MADANKRKRGEVPSPPACEDNAQSLKRQKRRPVDIPGEGEYSCHQASLAACDGVVTNRGLANVEQVKCEVTDAWSSSVQEEMEKPGDVNQGTAWDTEAANREVKALEDGIPVHLHVEPASSSELYNSGDGKGQVEALSLREATGTETTENVTRVSEILKCEGTGTSLASLDSVDMEAAQALTFLKQSASPTKSLAASSSRQGEESNPTDKSNTTLYTGSIRRKGFAKSNLAKQHLQKSTMKKLIPARFGMDTDSDSQHESLSSVSPQRMVIDLQPTRKSARQAAQDVKEKPWSMMMRRGKRTQLEKKFEKGTGGKTEDEERKVETVSKKKETRGRKRGTKGPTLDADEMALATKACDTLEKRLEEKAAKNNLSVVNVKNILHHVITNEHVLAMVHNTMGDGSSQDNPSSPSGSRTVVFEPKMTRAKLKEVSEKSGKIPFVWPVSPLKKPKPQFTDLNFSDSDDDDDDYKPSQEDLLKDESDYESITSFGSPCPSTPRSSLNTSFLEDLEEDDDVIEEEVEERALTTSPPSTPSSSVMSLSPGKGSHLRAIAVPMGPPPPRIRSEKLKDDAKFLRQLDEVNQELEISEDTIAHRTRSKFPIDTPLEEIEASFVAPDFTEDMFHTWDDCGEDNEDWVRWLAGLYSRPNDPEVSDVGEDDQNDPEYNFLAEEEALDEEDFRNDKMVRISKKEVNELLDELIDAYENEDWASDFDMQHFDRPPQLTLSDMISAQRQTLSPREALKTKKVRSVQQQQQVLVFTDSERAQLQQQMQQHVQLLAQLNILSKGCKLLEPHMNQAKMFLSELDMLAGRSDSTYGALLPTTGTQQPVYPCSAFRSCNLAGALQITTQDFLITEKELISMKANDSWRTKTDDCAKRKNHINRSPPAEGAQVIIAHSKVFMYSELLPIYSLTDKPLDKTIFEKSEDILIILGLMQFPLTKEKQGQYRMIIQNMLPIKTTRQVMVHVKNVCSKQNSQNVIKNWRKHGIKPILTAPCAPVLQGNKSAPIDQFQLYDKKPEWLKKYQSSFYPHQSRAVSSPLPETPASKPEIDQTQNNSKITPIPTSQTIILPLPTLPTKDLPVEKTHKARAQSFSKLDAMLPSLGMEGHQRVRTMFPKIAPKPSDDKKVPTDVSQQSVLVMNPQRRMINTVCGTTVRIIKTAGGGFALSQQNAPLVLKNHTASTNLNPTAATNVNPTAATNVNPAAATNVNPAVATTVNPTPGTNAKSSDSHLVTPALIPNSSTGVSSSISPSRISALQNLKVQPLSLIGGKNVSDMGKADKRPRKDRRRMKGKSKETASESTECASKEISKQSSKKKKVINVHEKSDKQTSSSQNSSNCDVNKCAVSESKNSSATDKKCALFKPSSSPTSTKCQNDADVVIGKDNSTAVEADDPNMPKEGNRPPSRSKSNTPDSLLDDEGLEEYNLEDAVSSPGENILENADSNSQDILDADSLPDTHLSRGAGGKEGAIEGRQKASSLTTKMAAKRMKTKLRRDLESTVVLLDSEIVSKDPKREERETSFSRAYLNKVKERFSTDPERYVDFLGIFNSFSQTPEIPADEVYQKICQALEGHSDLVEDFTAFLPPDMAVECGVLMENLEFAKARLFLRQVEVHFQKNPSQFQKVLGTIMEWGSKETRTNNELQESLLPLLKGQPHLEQEFSLLFPDERPPDNYMMDFEEIMWDDDKDKEYDSFEEIEIPDSDEEVPMTKSRVGRPPNKPPSSTQTPSGIRASAIHGLLPKAALLKGRLPSILKSPAGKKSAARLKSQALDPWQELNTHLQYGTQGCKCNCHEKSHDSRVQRKVRHCAYCSAMVTRTELISSLRGFTMGNRRRAHLLTASQQPGTSEDATAQGISSKRGSGRNLSGRKSQKVHWASTEDGDREIEDEEDEEEENPYSDAVAHLSEICANLADYLNENASEEEDEEEKETDVDDDDDANDDADDDAEDVQDDDDYEDLEEEDDDQDDKPEDDEEDDDDGGDDAIITSEESRGLEGATSESTVSPIPSQGSHESIQSEGSSGSKPGLQQAQHCPSSETTLLGSGVIHEGNGSRANSPVTYDQDDRSTEDHMRQLKEHLSLEKEEGGSASHSPSVKSLVCKETSPDPPVKHFSAIGKSAKTSSPTIKREKDGSNVCKEADSSSDSLKSAATVTTTRHSSRLSAGETGQRSSPRKPVQRAIRRVKTVRPTYIPKVPFGQSKPVPLFESLAKCKSSPKVVKTAEVPSSSGLAKRTSEEPGDINKVEQDEKGSDLEKKLIRTHESTPEKQSPDVTEAAETSSQEGTVGAGPSGVIESPKDGNKRPDPEKAGGSPLLSAANVARRKDGEVVVVWTRDADRLLLHQCRDQGATEEVFEEVAKTLGDKTSEQVADRFTTLMKLFQSASQDREEDEEDVSGDDEDDDKQESDVQDNG